MPLMMIAFRPLEFVVTPETTYILIGGSDHYRRIFTDGRDWPKDLEATFAGYTIGHWIDEDGDGRYDVLEAETRGPFKGPRAYDASGLPLAFDNQSIFKERIYRDKADPKILHDVITVIDHALTRPWTVDKKYVLEQNFAPRMGRELLHREQRLYRHRQGQLLPQRRRHADAGPQGPAAAGPALFQADAEVTAGSRRAPATNGGGGPQPAPFCAFAC